MFMLALQEQALIGSLMAGMTRTELVEFVKQLDARMADWDSTLELCEYFAKLKAEHEREVAEGVAK